MRPTRDIEELERRFKAISFFRNPRHNDILTTLTETLQRVRKINVSILSLSVLKVVSEDSHLLGNCQKLFTKLYSKKESAR